MPMSCNIDRRGRLFRAGAGAALEAVGVALLVMSASEVLPAWAFWVGLGAALGGVIMMIEGFVGFCVLRGMGLRTPL